MQLVRAEGITKSYGSGESAIEVLHGIDLTIRTGELTMIMGPSGSGKTTLLSILGCLMQPTRGRLWLGDREVSALTERTLPLIRRREIAFVFQSFNLFESLTALENVEVALFLAGEGKRAARRRALDLLEQVGIRERAGHVPQDLSGGQKQRVAIARALASPARLLLADEPTGALDSTNGRRVMELLRDATTAGKAVVTVTHDPRVRDLADRVITIEDGVIHSDVRPTLEAAHV